MELSCYTQCINFIRIFIRNIRIIGILGVYDAFKGSDHNFTMFFHIKLVNIGGKGV